MIDIDECKKTFFEYIEKYDMSDPKINLKVVHTLKVLKMAEYIADSLNLDEENRKLCQLIALLHDIGRFEQVRIYGTFSDIKSIDHAEYGVKILFEDGLIRKFVKNDKYDSVIRFAIRNHNKYKIEENSNENEMLHAKIIRDADKIDIFRVEYTEDMKTLLDVSEMEVSRDVVSDNIFDDFLKHRPIKWTEVVTKLDNWLLNIALIFDINFPASMKYLLDNSYIEKLFDRINYLDDDTVEKMEVLKNDALCYANDRVHETVL